MGFRRALTAAFCLVLAALGAPPAWAEEPRAKLSTLEWPPYSGADLPGGGVTVAVVRSALAAVGWRLDVEVLPWKRAVEAARAGEGGTVGYFPEYFDVGNIQFALSQPMGASPVGFAESAQHRISWTRLEDLAVLGAIGVVDGYSNSAEFDTLVANGALKVEAVNEDILNLKKIAAGRIRIAVIDRHVMAHLLKNEKALAPFTSRLAFNSNLLMEQKLYAAFRRSPEADEARAALNRGLALLGDDVAKRYRQLDLFSERQPLVAQR